MYINVIQKVKELNLKPKEFIIVAGSAMAVYELKETGDVDLVISSNVYKRFKAEGWEEKFYDDKTSVLLYDIYDAGMTWYDKNLNELLQSAEFINGTSIVNLNLVLKWKLKMNREKDQKDIIILESYLSKKW